MAKSLGITQTSYTYLEQKAEGMKFSNLVNIKKVSGLSWQEFGKLLEAEAKKIEKRNEKRQSLAAS